VLGIKNAAKLVPIEDDATPVDPVQENQDILTGKPVKAFIEQNHEAHIRVHMAAIQDPKIQQLMQMNPQAQAIMAAAMAHVNEHIAFEYRKQIEQMMGTTLPPQTKRGEEHKEVPPEVADQIAVMAAQAAQQLLQQNQQQAAQQAAQQQMQDPVVQMQMKELQLKEQDLQLKAQKQQIEAAEKADRIRIEEARIQSQMQIAAMQVGAQAAAAKDKAEKQQMAEGVRIGADMAKHRAQMAVQQAQRAAQRNQPSKKENK
jgi:hypothetical protein